MEALQNGTPVVMSDRVRIADFLNNIKGYNIFNYGNLDDFIAKVNSTIGTGVDTDTINQIFSASVAKQKYKQKYISIL